MPRARPWALLLSLCNGCDPLIATVGYETDAGGARDAQGADAWFETDAQLFDDAAVSAPDAHEGLLEEAGAQDGAVPLRPECIWMPDLVDEFVRSDGGVRSVDSGVVSASLDLDLGCNAPENGMVYVTYARVDGAPLLREGVVYAIPPGKGPGGTMNWLAVSRPCEQPLFAVPNFWLSLPAPLTLCYGEMRGPGQVLRMQVPPASPFAGDGFQLCEAVCGSF